jgi:hypothetical protein
LLKTNPLDIVPPDCRCLKGRQEVSQGYGPGANDFITEPVPAVDLPDAVKRELIFYNMLNNQGDRSHDDPPYR